MPETKDIIPKLEIEKARNALEEAKILFDSEKYYGAANRSYYAAFHSMSVSDKPVTFSKSRPQRTAIIRPFCPRSACIHRCTSKAAVIRMSAAVCIIIFISESEPVKPVTDSLLCIRAEFLRCLPLYRHTVKHLCIRQIAPDSRIST